MNTRQTKHQVARGTRPDAERNDALFLVKNVSSLRLTYQIRLLTYRALELRKKLRIRVPKHCTIQPSLANFQKEHSGLVKIERL
jgi:hypothetical protein